MFRSRKYLPVISLLIAGLIASGCSPVRVPAPLASPSIVVESPTATANPAGKAAASNATSTAQATSLPSQESTLSPANTLLQLANSCKLIDSYDLAHLFPPHNEIVQDPPKTGQVTQPPFSSSAAAGTQTECVFYDFHQPGKLAGWMLQVTYLVDVPDPTAQQAWRQAWADAKAKSGQVVRGVGDDAFASGGNLFIQKGDTYLAFESVDTHVDGTTSAGMQQLLSYDMQLAEDGFKRLN